MFCDVSVIIFQHTFLYASLLLLLNCSGGYSSRQQ